MQRVTILYDASQAVLSTFDADEVLQRILTIAQDYFHLRTVAILLLDEETRELHVRSHIGWSAEAEKVRVALGVGLTGIAAKIKRPVYASDVSKDSRCVGAVPGTASELAIPLMVRDSVVGVLDCQSDNLDHFDKETIDLLTLFSTQASMALQNARLYSLEQKRATQLQAINSIARHATSVLELNQLLHSVCTLVQRCFPGDHACVLLREEDALILRAQYGSLTPLLEEGEVFPCEGKWWNQSLSSAEDFLGDSSGIETIADLSSHEGKARLCEEAQSRISIPMISYGQPLGLMVLSSREPNFFAHTETQPLESVADIFSSAIQNANYVQRVKQLAYLDGLTGIFNRRYFETRIKEEIERARRFSTELAVVMVDVDKFKSLNDTFGHLLGDEVLRQVSSLMSRQIRKIDVVCRYGGEEFVVLLPQTGPEQALHVANKLRLAVEEWKFPGVPRTLTISGGVGVFPQHGQTPEQLVKAADAALYAAKEAGRNCMLSAGSAQPARAGA
jgi:diguanylate cyclase (GGDEF)-like protein